MNTNFELFWRRIKEAAEVNTDSELSNYLGIRKTTLSMWKSRERVDYDLLFNLFEQKNINYHWLLTGNGPKYNSDTSQINEPATPYGFKDEFEELLLIYLEKPSVRKKIIEMAKKKSEIKIAVTDDEQSDLFNDLERLL